MAWIRTRSFIVAIIGAMIATSAVVVLVNGLEQTSRPHRINKSISPGLVPDGTPTVSNDVADTLSLIEQEVADSLPERQQQDYQAAVHERNQAQKLLLEVTRELESIRALEQQLLKTEFEHSQQIQSSTN